MSNLRQTDKKTKRLLFEKSQETLSDHAKVLSLRNKVTNLQEKVEESQAKMAKLEERATQQEVRLGQLEGELVRKDELFNQTKEEFTNDASNSYAVGFEDAMAQVVYAHPGWIFPKLAYQRRSLMRSWSMPRIDSLLAVI